MSGAVPPPSARPLERAARVPRPGVPGAVCAAVGTQHRPHSVCPCGPALLAVGLAEGRPRGGCLPPLRGASEVRHCPSPDCPPTGAGCWGPPPTCCGRGFVGVGAQHRPLGLHALWGLRAAGVVGGRPLGGWPATVVRGAWSQALSLPRPPVLWSGQLGFRDPVSRVRLVRAWGPSTGPTACALAGWRCSLWGWRRGVPEGGAFHRCEGRLRSGAVPPPTARPLGGPFRSATHVLWARVCGCVCPTLLPWPACPVEAVCRGGGGGLSPGGVACHGCQRCLVSGAVPPPAARPLEQAARVPRPVCPGCGRCGRGDPAPPHSVRPCGPALLAVELAEGRPRGGCLLPL